MWKFTKGWNGTTSCLASAGNCDVDSSKSTPLLQHPLQVQWWRCVFLEIWSVFLLPLFHDHNWRIPKKQEPNKSCLFLWGDCFKYISTATGAPCNTNGRRRPRKSSPGDSNRNTPRHKRTPATQTTNRVPECCPGHANLSPNAEMWWR